jgi:four helix bundle protein
VASNIAEGYERRTTADYLHFLGMSRGSNLEVQTQLTVAGKLGFGDPEEIERAEACSVEVSKMLVYLMSKVAARRRQE